jgi:DNA adenine methylase
VFGEPYAGSAAVLFAKPIPSVSNTNHYLEFLNDTNRLVVNFYRVGIKRTEELLTEINATLYSQSDYARAIEICKSEESEYDELTRAWAFFVNVSLGFGSQLNSGFGTGVFSKNLGSTWHNRKLNLSSALKRLEKVQISCEPALQCIERMDAPQTLIYVDPPYPETDQGHYKGFSMQDWQDLCDLLDNSQCSYVLSNYPQSIEPKSAQRRLEFSANCSASGKGTVGKGRDKTRAATTEEQGDRTRTEVLWVCDRSDRMRRSLLFPANNQQLQLFQ